MYYKEREDLEHLGWIDLSSTVVIRSVPEVEEPLTFALDSLEPERRVYILRAGKKEHFTMWLDMLMHLTVKFKAEKEVSVMSLKERQNSRAEIAIGERSPRRSRNGSGDPSEDSEEVEEHGSQLQALKELQVILERVRGQEELLNEAAKKVEKWKQKAFALEELLEFQRESVVDPAKKLNSLMKGYTQIERLVERLGDVTVAGRGGRAAGSHEAEMRVKLMLQRSEAQVAQERRQRRELEERLFRSEVMSMKLNELLSGRDVNTIDANKLWHECRKAGIESSEYGSWIQAKIVAHRTMRVV